MRIRAALTVAALASFALFVPAGGHATQTRGFSAGHRFIPSGSPSRHAAVESLNWAGYVTTGKVFNGVSTTYVVPTAEIIVPGLSATWAGIGGYDTGDLIQAGTEQDSLPGLAGYYAWYEMLPGAEIPITSGCVGNASCAVNPGDTMTVTITNTSGNNWLISMNDHGHWTWSKTVSYASTRSSAEWIHEAPTLLIQTLLAYTGTTTFDGGQKYRVGSTWSSFTAGAPIQVDLALVEATTSPIDSDNDGFNVCAYSLSCAAPAS